ncbi:DinI family protein [Enterobacter hormaechei]|uniref:DinI family protein n=1 Tax=Enterobacter hormaechei TaxID=158836 RepID=A0A4Y5ZPR0_9ENTR|nr:DinI family protein [Enterobacter hormaechei]
MFVELVYDKRNVDGLEGPEIILAELTKRVHQIFPDAEVKVKPMQANGLNSDASKSDREKLNRMLEKCLKNPIWLVSEFPTVRRLAFKFYSGNIPDDCSGMNTEQPAAACSCI